MLDGLDEIANEDDQAKISRWIDRQLWMYSDTAFIITSRPFSGRKKLIKGITTFLEIRSINFKQAEQFILSWYLHYEDRKSQNAKNKRDRVAIQLKAYKKANRLIARIKGNPYLFQLTSTPLLLIMIITIYENGYELPKSRGALYKEICKVMIERRIACDGQRRAVDLTADQTLSVLQNLAFELVMRERLFFSLEENHVQNLVRKNLNDFPNGKQISVEKFITYVVKDVGLLVPSDQAGAFEFNHRCIQEYLAASMIKSKRCEHLLIERILHEWWSETIRLYAAQSNATQIIQEAHKLATSGTKSIVAFKLVYDCLAEAMQVDLQLRTRLENALDRHLSSTDLALRSKAAEVKLIQRFDKLVPVERNLEIDQTHIMACEYQLFIDEQLKSKGEYYQPDYWLQPTFTIDMAVQPITGIRPQDAVSFCTWLTQKYGNGGFKFRLPTTTEENRFLHEKLIQQQLLGSWCIHDDTYRVESLDPKLSKVWDQIVLEQLSQQIYWSNQLKIKVSETINACLSYQQMDVKSLFQSFKLPYSKFSSYQTQSLGLDVAVVDHLIWALSVVETIYQRIQKARSEAKGYDITKQRKDIQNLTKWAEQHPTLQHYQLSNTFRLFEKKLGLHNYPIRDLAFNVAQSIIKVLIEFLTLAEHHIIARIRDLQAAKDLCAQERVSDLYDLSRCQIIGQEFLANLKAGSLSKKHIPKLLKQLNRNDVGLMHLMHPERIAKIEQDFEYSFSRRSASKRNVLNACAHLLMAASLWYSLARSHPLAKTAQLTKQLIQKQKLSDMNYLDKRNQALKAYVVTMLLDQQIKGQLLPWGSIRIVRERILD